MTKMKKIITATAATLALMAPLVGTAEAKRGEHFDGHKKTFESRNHINQRQFVRLRRNVYTPLINRRIRNQERRINRGRRFGRLTRFETRRLRNRLFAIKSARRFARIDGHVSRWERRKLFNMLDANSKRIRRLSQNGRRNFRGHRI